jgi:hypothetical protein
MGVEEFTTTVAGRSGRPVATAPNGTIQTDNYEEVLSVEDDGTGYPLTVDPSFLVQESVVIEVGDVDAEITTNSGTTETVRLHGKPLTLDTIVTEKVVFRDPRGTGAELTALFIGE